MCVCVCVRECVCACVYAYEGLCHLLSSVDCLYLPRRRQGRLLMTCQLFSFAVLSSHFLDLRTSPFLSPRVLLTLSNGMTLKLAHRFSGAPGETFFWRINSTELSSFLHSPVEPSCLVSMGLDATRKHPVATAYADASSSPVG